MTTASCHDPRVFAAYMRERFLSGKKTTAVKVVEQLAKDQPLSEAVLNAIESLTTRESKDLRRVVDQFHAWCEWRDVWELDGWTIEHPPRTQNLILLVSPTFADYPENAPSPSSDVVAAAVRASSARMQSSNVIPWNGGWRKETYMRTR